jgi:FAD/FMN-containing dehydrogenase
MSALSLTMRDGREATCSMDTLSGFRSRMRGSVLVAGDPQYGEARRIWNGAHDKRPAIIARCSGVADVIEAVNFGRETGALVAVRGGGHNVAGTSMCDGGLVIDLSPMKGIRVDPTARRAWAQAGATWGDLDRETQAFSLMTPGGNISSTGIAGLTLGGGMGWFRRAFGMSADNVVSVDIVTADGQVRTVSEQEHDDLFWAIRGGGGNFGVVTSFEYQLHPLGPQVMLAAPMYAAEHAEQIVRYWRQCCEDAPDEFSSYVLFMTVPSGPPFPEALHGRRVVLLAAAWAGAVEEGAQRLQPLRECEPPLIDLSGPLTYVALQSAFDWVFPKGNLYYWKTLTLDRLDDEAIATVVSCATSSPSSGTVVGIWQLGGALSRRPATTTAYGRRDEPFLVNIDSGWVEPRASDQNIAWTRDCWTALQRFSRGGMYLNYGSLEPEEQVRAVYGQNYDRLVRIKDKYDPTNVFRLNQNIKPSGSVDRDIATAGGTIT